MILRLRKLTAFVFVMSTVFIAIPRQTTNAEEIPVTPELEEYAAGFNRPVFVTNAGDGSNKLYVMEQNGIIRILSGGMIYEEPFLDISDLVLTSPDSIEQGMLGLAFHPEYASNGYLFLTYVSKDNELRCVRYQVQADPDHVDPSTAFELFALPYAWTVHYSGMLAFGPDGYLYVGVGDGAFASSGQYLANLNGSILRIDVDGDAPYAIPSDNPFVDDPEARPEIWSYGLRNPWRFSFDILTGDLYLGDVGEATWEEVDFQPAESNGGENYGWSVVEGNHCNYYHTDPEDCDPSLYQRPIHEYARDEGCAVVGGYVYRGDVNSSLYGHYVFGDYCNGTIWSLNRDGGEWQISSELFTDLWISTFGQDEYGNLFVADILGGTIYRLVMPGEIISPLIFSMEPDLLYAGGVACQVGIRGSGFGIDSTVSWNGSSRPATFVDSTMLMVELSSAELVVPASISVAVTNASSGKRSNPSELVITGNGQAGNAIWSTWASDDGSVASGAVARSWMWGASGLSCPFSEPYIEGAAGSRMVQYFDKARMEVTDPEANPESPWFVTNGLLVLELVTGRIQWGDELREQREPASVNVAGDPNDPDGPTYLTFSTLLDEAATTPGLPLLERVDRDGAVVTDPALVFYDVTAGRFVPETGHTIASPFWEFMSSLQQADGNPFYSTGYPISEAYWADVRVGGESKTVLMQLFERRVLTFTPSNPPAWQVEAGNVGQHYFRWRYDQ